MWKTTRYGGIGGGGLTGFLFAGDTAYARLSGDTFTAGAMQMWWRGAFLTKPSSRTGYVFGNSDFGTPGFVLGSQGYPGDAAAPGRIYGWANATYKVPPISRATLVMPTEGLGKPVTIHAWRDAGGLIHVAIDGQEWTLPIALGMADLGSTLGCAINTRISSGGANPHGTLVTYEMGFATSVPLLADVRAHATAPPGTTLPGTLEFFDARFPGITADRWTGTILGKQLVLTGPVSRMKTSGNWGLGLGTVSFWGDSHLLGRSGPTGSLSTAGFRRGFFNNLWAAGVSVTMSGFGINGGVDDPHDYDNFHSGVGGKGIGVPSAGNSMRTDVATEMAQYISPSGVRIIGTWANDMQYRVNTLGESAAVASANGLTDLGAIVGEMRANGHTGRIWILDCPRPSTASAPNAVQRNAIDLFNAGFMSTVDNARTTHGGEVRGFQLSTRTPDFSGAGLADGTHADAPLYASWAGDLSTWALGLAR